MKHDWKAFVISLLVVYVVAFIGGTFTSDSVNSQWYDSIKPEITPPNWVFPIIWNILFFFIALSLYLAWISAKNFPEKKIIALLFGLNLFLNAFWSYVFFGMQNTTGAFYVLIALLISIISIIYATWKINRISSYLLIPYFLWVAFAGILNYIIAF